MMDNVSAPIIPSFQTVQPPATAVDSRMWITICLDHIFLTKNTCLLGGVPVFGISQIFIVFVAVALWKLMGPETGWGSEMNWLASQQQRYCADSCIVLALLNRFAE